MKRSITLRKQDNITVNFDGGHMDLVCVNATGLPRATLHMTTDHLKGTMDETVMTVACWNGEKGEARVHLSLGLTSSGRVRIRENLRTRLSILRSESDSQHGFNAPFTSNHDHGREYERPAAEPKEDGPPTYAEMRDMLAEVAGFAFPTDIQHYWCVKKGESSAYHSMKNRANKMRLRLEQAVEDDK